MIICKNCGKTLSELTAGIHSCSRPLVRKICDYCGEELITREEHNTNLCDTCWKERNEEDRDE